MTQANMSGSEDTRNSLSDGHSTSKEKGDSRAQTLTYEISSTDTSSKADVDIQPRKAPEKKGTTERQSQISSRNSKVSTPGPINESMSCTLTRSGTSGISPIQGRSAIHKHVGPDEFLVRKTKAHDHLRSARPPGCQGESTQATANSAKEVHSINGELASTLMEEKKVPENGEKVSPLENRLHNNSAHVTPRANGANNPCEHVLPRENGVHNNGAHASPRGDEVHNNNEQVSPTETGTIRVLRSSNTPDCEGGRSSPSCNSEERKSSRGSLGSDKEHAFIDKFDTKEQPWKPGKKVNDHSNDQPRSEYRWKSSRKSIPGADQMQSRTSERSSDDLPVSRKGRGSLTGGAAHVQREYDPYGNHLNVLEWGWHPRKGRGNGPLPGEWLPPFRSCSTTAESEPSPFSNVEGSGRRHSDEGLSRAPFLVVDRPASWHRSKGAGSRPPPDQWLPPWRHEH